MRTDAFHEHLEDAVAGDDCVLHASFPVLEWLRFCRLCIFLGEGWEIGNGFDFHIFVAARLFFAEGSEGAEHARRETVEFAEDEGEVLG